MKYRVLFPESDCIFDKFQQILIAFYKIPVEPGNIIVLAIGVIVALEFPNSSPAMISGVPWLSSSRRNALRNCRRRICRIFIFLDGPSTPQFQVQL